MNYQCINTNVDNNYQIVNMEFRVKNETIIINHKKQKLINKIINNLNEPTELVFLKNVINKKIIPEDSKNKKNFDFNIIIRVYVVSTFIFLLSINRIHFKSLLRISYVAINLITIFYINHEHDSPRIKSISFSKLNDDFNKLKNSTALKSNLIQYKINLHNLYCQRADEIKSNIMYPDKTSSINAEMADIQKTVKIMNFLQEICE
ncbi:MAG: hypothetical protein Q8K60_06490 [Parachlamydiaceae bacterium]|nr:hypothetical protein [Parachlamydiaceae bacterium]